MGESAGVTDPWVNGESIGFAARETGDSLFESAYEELLAWALSGAPRNDDGIVYHVDGKPQFWVDFFYMLMESAANGRLRTSEP